MQPEFQFNAKSFTNLCTITFVTENVISMVEMSSYRNVPALYMHVFVTRQIKHFVTSAEHIFWTKNVSHYTVYCYKLLIIRN